MKAEITFIIILIQTFPSQFDFNNNKFNNHFVIIYDISLDIYL